MGKPEPCVLFSQTFVHPQLDEYVDEVLFAEPVVVSACEFLEQNGSSACSSVKLMGATSPPSFALEVFVQCEGETRFRRLCQPFLYSHSSSNVLEVEAVVTNHLVVRGSYRSLSLIIYGNTAEDLGQFNIEVDLDNSLTNTVSTVEGDLEDLPPALRPASRTIEESVSSLRTFSLKEVTLDISFEIKQLLQLTFKILELPNCGLAANRIINPFLSAASVYAGNHLPVMRSYGEHFRTAQSSDNVSADHILNEARKELQDVYEYLHHQCGNPSAGVLAESLCIEPGADLPTSKVLVENLKQYLHFNGPDSVEQPQFSISNRTNAILWLSASLLLCSARESCFYFVNGGYMEQLVHVFTLGLLNSTAVKLLVLGVIEQATRHSIGCEGFLGWWPREDERVPSGFSEGYNQLLKLLLQNPHHDVASLATYILHRMRVYEVASRYEFAVLSVLGGLSTVGEVTGVTLDLLGSAKVQLKKLLGLLTTCGPIEDPSPAAYASSSLLLGDSGLLTYKATSALVHQSKFCFSNRDMDPHLLSLLKDRGFLPLSAALLSSTILRSQEGEAMNLFVDIVSDIGALIFSLLSCRSGLIFLLHDPEMCTTLIHALRGFDACKVEECASLRYASVLRSKGFFCHPWLVGTIIEIYLKAINAIDRLVTSTPNTEEFLWVLWELCGLSRSDCGRQALLIMVHFPEALSVLMDALHSVRDLDPVSLNNGSSPLNLSVFHSAAEIFEIIVTDSTASSLGSWIEHAKELHRVLLSTSPGSNKKDAPTRLLEWIDASVVYHRNGAIGLLRYAAVLTSGGDAPMASTTILTADTEDIDTIVGDHSANSDGNLIDNLLGKRITEKDFPGVVLRDSSIAQLTTAFRILASLSDNSVVAAALYDEGAVMVIHAVLINCRLMLERSSNNYDYLVDEGTEYNSTSDLLLERNREQSVVDLLIPSLMLLLSLLQKLQESKEQHRNTKLMTALLQLHREVSPRLAVCAADISYSFPGFALGFGAVCHLIVSVLACWPVYGWSPGLFHFLLDSLQVTTLLALGPKDSCSVLCLLNDMFPEEGVWLWKNGMPMLGALRTLAVGALLGPQKERDINWYLQPENSGKLLGQLTPQIDKIAQMILHCAASTLVVVQDITRVFIIRIACLNIVNASTLVQPIILWICNRLSERSPLSDAETYKVYRLLDFLAILLEHPHAKPLLLKDGSIQMFTEVLSKCIGATNSGIKQYPENINAAKEGFSVLSWCIPVFKSISLLGDSRAPRLGPMLQEKHFPERFTAEEYLLVLSYLLKLCKVLPVGKELLACLSAFRDMGTSADGQNALLSIFLHIQSNIQDSASGSQHVTGGVYNLIDALEWNEHPPLLCCWTNITRSITLKDEPPLHAFEAIGVLCSGALCFCIDGESLNLERVAAIKYLFGVANDVSERDGFLEESRKSVLELANLFDSKVDESLDSFVLLLQKPTDLVKPDDISPTIFSLLSTGPISSRMHKVADGGLQRIEDYELGDFGDNFLWECPENLRLTQTGLPAKRKISSLEGPNRRARGDNSPIETVTQSTFPRGSLLNSANSGPTRRDTFRQRKPNTSRPPSMHVDDYVARERNADGNNNSNVIAIPRLGSSSGRPPSIHVDEFMARQRERQTPVGMAVSDSQAKKAPPESKLDSENLSKSQQLKPDLDDDLQGIDIVFDAEETEPDDKLPFPQPDESLQQPPSVLVEQSSTHSIVEETESDANESSQFSRLGTPVASNMDENTPSEFSSRMSVSRPEISLTREPSISSEKKFPDPYEDSKHYPVKAHVGFDSAGASNSPRLSTRPLQNSYPKASMQQSGGAPSAVGSQGFYDKKMQSGQPPLPPMPPPSTIIPVISQTADSVASQSSPYMNPMADIQPPLPPGFHGQPEYLSALSNSSTPLVSSSPLPDTKYVRQTLSSTSGSTRPPPPLPPTPPPHLANLSTSSSMKSTSQSLFYQQNVTGTSELQQTSGASSSDGRLSNFSVSGAMLSSYPPPPLVPPLVFGRPGSMPASPYGNNSTPHHADNLSNLSQNLPMSLPPVHSLPSLAHLQPLQPPQLPRPPPHHLRPPIPASPPSEQGVALLQSPLQMQVQPMQMLQQSQLSPANMYFQTQQPDNISRSLQQIEHSQPQSLHRHGDLASPQDDSGMSLQHFFRSPEAIQSLLSDRDKLCQLLEQHPKLMQMLQERLGHL